jgi:hypothetical protein
LADDHCQHLQRARLPTAAADLRRLKPRERRDLYLRALGYRYNEIAELTCGAASASELDHAAAALDESEQRPTRDAGRSAAAP